MIDRPGSDIPGMYSNGVYAVQRGDGAYLTSDGRWTHGTSGWWLTGHREGAERRAAELQSKATGTVRVIETGIVF